MRSFILGIVLLVAIPAYAAGQQRGRPERSATGRTAVPRETAGEAAPARQADRRAEPRGDTRTQVPRAQQSDDAAAQRAGSERRSTQSAAETVRGRFRDDRPQSVPPRTFRTNSPRLPGGPASIALPGHGTYWTNRPRLPGGPASIPLPGHGLRPFPDRDDRRPGHGDRDFRPRFRRPHSGANVVFLPYAAPFVVEREVVIERGFINDAASAPVFVEQPALARLILDIHPPAAQVFADGYYIGIPEDFRAEHGGAVLEPGPHRIDIVAPGYEPVSFDVNLARGQSATFRHVLTPIAPPPQPAPGAAAPAPQAAKQPATFYLIPGCYLGNVPPKDANLPATCDIARAVTVQY